VKSGYRELVQRIMDSDPAVTQENLRRQIAEELGLDKLPSRSQVYDLRREYLIGLKHRTVQARGAVAPPGWSTDTLRSCLRRNFSRFPIGIFYVADALLRVIERNAAADPDTYTSAPEYKSVRSDLPALLEEHARAHPDPEQAGLRELAKHFDSLTLMKPAADFGDWSALDGLIAALRKQGAMKSGADLLIETVCKRPRPNE
jgi:hypothetical protein